VASTLQTQEYPIREIDVAWASQSNTGGNPISAYKIEYFADYAIKEVQTVETTNANQGNFKLYFKGGVTTDMTFDVSDVNMRYALMNINSGNCAFCIGNVLVTREGATNGYKWHITFLDAVKNTGDQPPIVGVIGSLASTLGGTPALSIRETVTGRRANGGFSEVQEITISGNAALTGFWRASFAGSGYGNYIAWNAADSEVKRELEMLSTAGIVSVTRTGDASSTSCSSACAYGYKWLVTFNTNVGNVPKLVVTNADLYAGGSQAGSAIAVMDGDNSVDANGRKLCDNCYPGETPAEFGSAVLPSTTFSYRVTQRVSGTAYFVRVAAANNRGYGPVGNANSGSTITPPKQQPGKPTNASVAVFFGVSSKLRFRYSAPLTDGGDPIMKYMIEYDTSNSFSNAGSVERRCPTYPIRQTFTMHMKLKKAGDSFVAYDGSIAQPSTFIWTLTRAGKQYSTQKFQFDTKAMSVDEAANGDSDVYTTLASPINTGSVQSNLENLASLGSNGAGGAALKGVNVVRSGSISGANAVGYTWTITFLGDGNDFDIDVLPANNLIKTTQGDAASATYGDETYVEFVKTKLFDGQAYTSCTETDVILPGLVQGTPYYTRVIAYNTLGYGLPTTLTGALKPMRVPQSPSGVTVSVASGTSLRVVFSPPSDDGGDTIDKYNIEWDLFSNFSSVNGSALGSHEVLYLAGGAPFHYTITSMIIGQPYYLRVSAHNSQGYGLPEATSPASEYPREIPSAPSSVQLRITSGSKLTVQYALPSHTGGDVVSKYKIEWDRASSFSSLLALPHKGEVEMLATQNMSYTINDVAPGAIYYVRVSAANSIGYGPAQITNPTFASPSNQRPGKIINANLQKFNSTTLQIEWDAPFIPAHGIPCSGKGTSLTNPNACPTGMGYGTDADGGSPITRYWIEWDVQSDFASGSASPDKGKYVFTALSTRPYQHFIKNLNPANSYFVRILAYNSVGPGDYCSKAGFLCDGSALTLAAGW
jgi:hypothetical protein